MGKYDQSMLTPKCWNYETKTLNQLFFYTGKKNWKIKFREKSICSNTPKNKISKNIFIKRNLILIYRN